MKFSIPDCISCQSKSNGLLRLCSLEELEEVAGHKNCQLYKKKEEIFHEGGYPHGLYCINRGMVKLFRIGSDGKEQIIRLAGPGDFLGYRSMLAGTPYTASATAIEDTVICLISKDTFFNILQNNQRLSEAMIKLLCSNLEEAQKQMAKIAYKPVRGRVAEALLLLQKKFDKQNGSNSYITITREDLAGLVGSVKETVIRVLSDFKDNKIVEVHGRKIKVLDREKLMEVSELYD